MSELHFASPDGLSLKLSLPSEQVDAAPEYRSALPTPRTLHRKPTWPQVATSLIPPAPTPYSASRSFGNPTPVGLGGFLLANTPATIMLLGWHGAGGSSGNQSAAVGAFFFMGCLLEIICGIGEWINGETFNAAVFLILGGYFGAAATVMVPFYNAVAGYGTEASAVAGYYDSYAMFLIFMGVLLLFFTIASVRLDVCHVILFACFTICFPCEAMIYYSVADGNEASAHTYRIWAGYTSLAGSLILWYLLLGSLLESVDFPYLLPVGDLKKYVKGRTEKLGSRRHKSSFSCGL